MSHFILAVAIIVSPLSRAEDWSELMELKAEIEGMIDGLDAKKNTFAHEDMVQTVLSRWAEMAARLDPESHNMLVFALLEESNQRGNAGVIADDMLSRLNEAIKPQLEAVSAKKDSAQVIPNALLNGLTIYSVGKLGHLCAATKCGDMAKKTWAWWFQKRMAKMAKVRVPPAGLLTYRPQPLPEVAGYLEFKQSTWKSFTQKARGWRPRSISAQLLLAGLAGAVISGGEAIYASLQVQKLPPIGMLRLLQVHKACDLSLMMIEMTKACTDKHPGCENKEEVQKVYEQIVTDSVALTSNFAGLENLIVRDYLLESEDLISRIPEKFRLLFSRILDPQNGDPRPICYRLAINDTAIGYNLEKAGLQMKSEAPKAKPAATPNGETKTFSIPKAGDEAIATPKVSEAAQK